MPETYLDPTFEVRLGPWIADLGEINVRPFDATEIAHAAAGAQTGRVRLGPSWGRYAADRRLFWVALIALLGALVWAMAIGIAGRPSTTPTIGRLAYTLDQHLYLADWDGSRSEVVRIPGVDAGATLDGLAWARSGRALAVGVTASDGRSSIVILDPEGSVIGRIELGRTDEATPLLFRWSPADDVLAVAIDAAGSVMISTYEADGTLITTDIDLPRGLTFRPWGSLDWAPSGDRFVVTGCVGCDDTSDDAPGPDVRGGLWIVQADGSGWQAYRPETSASSLRAPYEAVWSPTGDRIAFDGGCVRYDQDCATSGIWTMRPDGSGLMTVTSVPGLLLPAIWSPDGAHLVLLDHAGCMDFIQVLRACPSPHDSHLTIVDVPSGAVTRLNEGRGQDSPVAWPGDGSLIMFDRHAADTATGDDVPEVWAIRANGTAPAQRLVRGTTDAAWQWLPPATPDPTTTGVAPAATP